MPLLMQATGAQSRPEASSGPLAASSGRPRLPASSPDPRWKRPDRGSGCRASEVGKPGHGSAPGGIADATPRAARGSRRGRIPRSIRASSEWMRSRPRTLPPWRPRQAPLRWRLRNLRSRPSSLRHPEGDRSKRDLGHGQDRIERGCLSPLRIDQSRPGAIGALEFEQGRCQRLGASGRCWSSPDRIRWQSACSRWNWLATGTALPSLRGVNVQVNSPIPMPSAEQFRGHIFTSAPAGSPVRRVPPLR